MEQVTEDDVRHYIRKIRDVAYFNLKIIRLNRMIEELNEEMLSNQMKSPNISSVVIENRSGDVQQRYLEMILNEEQYIKQRDEYASIILKMEETFMSMDNVAREYMMELYLVGGNHNVIASSYGYSRQRLYKIVNREIKEMLKKNKRVTL